MYEEEEWEYGGYEYIYDHHGGKEGYERIRIEPAVLYQPLGNDPHYHFSHSTECKLAGYGLAFSGLFVSGDWLVRIGMAAAGAGTTAAC